MKVRTGLVLIGALLLLTPQAPLSAEQKSKKSAPKSHKTDARTPAKAPARAPEKAPPPPAAESPAPASAPAIDPQLSKEPTYITAANLTLFTETRKFTYSGKVEVKQGDMTLTSESLEGSYDESNKIENLAALKNVLVTKL